MKTTILGGFLVMCIVAGVVYRADMHWPANKPDTREIAQGTTQSVNNNNIILCPLSEWLLNGQKPTFTYRDENTWHPLQENMSALQVVAWVNNNKAVCKYFWQQTDKVFSIILPGNFGSCTHENDAYVWFSCN